MVVFLTITRTTTLPDALKSYVKEGTAQVGIGVTYMCRYKRVQPPKQWNSKGPQHEGPTACIIAHLITFSFPLGKILHAFQNCVF
jgi:hypothetical protein